MAEIFIVPTRGIGLPDYSAPQPTGQVPVGPTWTITDVGELAGRLGSIVTYDRRGRVVDFDNFEEPVLKWTPSWSGGSVYLHSVGAKSGSQSLALSTGAAIGNWAKALRGIPIPASRRLGFELSFGGSLYGNFYMDYTYYSGEYIFKAHVWLDFDRHLLYIYDGDLNDYSLLADVGVLYSEVGVNFFFTIKLVCDFEAGKFIRLMFGNKEWDISSVPIWKGGNDTAPHLIIEVWRQNTTAQTAITSIDDFIFTQAEP